MKLTGKCLEEFEKWFSSWNKDNLDLTIDEDFYTFPDAMKYGVLEDYFDSVGINIKIEKLSYDSYSFYHDISRHFECSGVKDSRPIARTAAIEKANEIRNEQLSNRQ